MKRFALACSFLVLTACGSDDPEKSSTPSSPSSPAPTAPATAGEQAPTSCVHADCTCASSSDCGTGQSCHYSWPYNYDAGDAGAADSRPSDPNQKEGFFHSESYGNFCTTPADKCTPTDNQNPHWTCDWQTDHWDQGSAP